MGLIKAGIGAVAGTMADQWKEFFYCDALSSDVLVVKGQKRTGSRSSNTNGSENVISNGSGIAVADGQCMIIVEQGKIVDICAEPGEFTYNTDLEPSLFTGDLSESISQAFKEFGKRFTYGGDTGKDQRVYYFNTKEIMDNKFGTANPFMFDVVNKKVGFSRTVQVRCNGVYSYRITNPLLFYQVCGNVEREFLREEIDSQLKTEFIDALMPAFAELSELELRPSQIPAHTHELKQAMNHTLKEEWEERRGITIEKIALNPITLTPEDMKKINQMEDAVSMGSNPYMMAGRMTDATATAMEQAASNPNGAMTGFMGMGMMPGGGAGGFQAAQGFYQQGQQQQYMEQEKYHQQQTASASAQNTADSWTCSCGHQNSGKFCTECGTKKTLPKADARWLCQCGTQNTGKFCTECGTKKPIEKTYHCDKCGWQPTDPHNLPKFCPQCGDPFNDLDIA
ncbi:Membrane protease subunit, stomatin/prohibitin family, contains C-terminal Zn-ribbon domain [Granulicatella balaenopterae]|uniref:Membrane protease subunit, stomatin/prohibitin family, contains C-terminal Zn-ribbon domain n=1 Tax=Granulicatella balaenopterae TaxID=137733 RepID=A0A1H9IRV5_9LACT|nr:SPFH domain-containing protein [Granulicatella balaenopterae]SEQ77310.1 Membrane protease subunit, stomatin/prohibitin family, contains C-terminal Zn-ribbon domain [Granulicatella balaenopterae]